MRTVDSNDQQKEYPGVLFDLRLSRWRSYCSLAEGRTFIEVMTDGGIYDQKIINKTVREMKKISEKPKQ